MDTARRTRISKFLSLVLRHQPATAGLTLGDGGWVRVDDLLAGARAAGVPFSREELEEVVRACDKQRFGIDPSSEMIRANQGHSAPVELVFDRADPPGVLYHGTASRNVPAILTVGLMKMGRHHVHLSPDAATATKVGARHGSPTVIEVDAEGMVAAGHTFFRSANGVYLVDHVPPQFLRTL